MIGRKAIQAFTSTDKSDAPLLKQLWVDIGATSREDAEKVVKVGTPITLQSGFARLRGNRAVAELVVEHHPPIPDG